MFRKIKSDPKGVGVFNVQNGRQNRGFQLDLVKQALNVKTLQFIKVVNCSSSQENIIGHICFICIFTIQNGRQNGRQNSFFLIKNTLNSPQMI
jgi:hypothetical protein